MKEPRNDDERLSALLDGRIKDPQRRELLAHLAASDDDLEVFADTAVILRQLEEGARAEPPKGRGDLASPPSVRKRGWRSPARAGLATVGLLVLAAVWVSRQRASALGDPVHLAARLEEPDSGLPAGWIDDPRWAAVRGGQPPAQTQREHAVAAAKAGILLTDLAVAVRAGDTTNTRILARQLRGRFEPGVGRVSPLRQIEDRAGAPAESLEPLLARATDRLEDQLGKDHLQLGAWTEAALLAARRRDAAFFRDDAMLRRAETLTGENPFAHTAVAGVRAAVERVRAATAAETPAWSTLEAELATLLHALASLSGSPPTA